MLPVATRVTTIDIYRDGGSLGVNFDGAEQEKCRLFFRVKRQNVLNEKGFITDTIRIGYLEPVITISAPVNLTSKIIEVTHTEYESIERTLSWEEARNLLETMKDLVENFEVEDMWRDEDEDEERNQEHRMSYYYQMLDAAKNKGAIGN
ncbi:hypothetical protein [Chamaesiphon sp. GL140_3_metabinner_50]|uniref:hypothetical protein n=1 Tax=Chamaesiphon sp. GL140_3_metabinner_50 TaxID=2970812 RepID=UPI0025D3044C|nr:hypothetical protein [Chamaesiphon sp. GL140_3_metabinner_50]